MSVFASSGRRQLHRPGAGCRDARPTRAGAGVPGAVLMSAAAFVSLGVLIVRTARIHRAARAAPWPRSTETARSPAIVCCSPVERVNLPLPARRSRRREQRWPDYTVSLLAFSFVSIYRAGTSSSGCRRGCPLGERFAERRPEVAFNTPVASSPTRTGRNYGRRVDHVLPLADGRPRGAELRVAAVGIPVAAPHCGVGPATPAPRSASSGST